jgi:hypothetical protein
MIDGLGSMEARIYRALCAAAEAGVECPSNGVLADLVGASNSRISALVSALESKGFICVERFTCARRVTICATGKVTAYDGATNAHWSRDGAPRPPRKPRQAPSSLRPAPVSLTPRKADAIIEVMDLMGLSAREAAEAGARRAQAWNTSGTVSDPLPVRHPTPILAAPERNDGDCRPFAPSREPCPRCQTRGDFGCALQRPFVAGVL